MRTTKERLTHAGRTGPSTLSERLLGEGMQKRRAGHWLAMGPAQTAVLALWNESVSCRFAAGHYRRAGALGGDILDDNGRWMRCLLFIDRPPT